MLTNYNTLKVNDRVAIARSGSWMTHSEGVYIVVKVDKMKIVLHREGDGYERVFSVKRKCEMGKDSSWRSAYLESVADMERRNAQLQHENNVRSAWRKAEQAAANKQLGELQDALAELEVLLK